MTSLNQAEFLVSIFCLNSNLGDRLMFQYFHFALRSDLRVEDSVPTLSIIEGPAKYEVSSDGLV